jgi:hypothetical protein
MECAWEECSYQQRCRRLAQPCQHPRTEEQLTVLPPDRTDVQGSIQNTATTEDDRTDTLPKHTPCSNDPNSWACHSLITDTATSFFWVGVLLFDSKCEPMTGNQLSLWWYSVQSYSYGTTTPTTRLQLVIYWRSVAAFILPIYIYMCWCYDNWTITWWLSWYHLFRICKLSLYN